MTAATLPDQDVDLDLDLEVPCDVTHNGIRCDQPAVWRFYWTRLCCAHRLPAGVTCEPHRVIMLETLDLRLVCRICYASCQLRPHIARIEAL